MKEQNWIFSIRYCPPSADGTLPPIERWAVVGPARASTVEAALQLATVPEFYRAEIRGHATVRDFIDGKLDPDRTLPGYYFDSPVRREEDWRLYGTWVVGLGTVHEVLR